MEMIIGRDAATGRLKAVIGQSASKSYTTRGWKIPAKESESRKHYLCKWFVYREESRNRRR